MKNEKRITSLQKNTKEQCVKNNVLKWKTSKTSSFESLNNTEHRDFSVCRQKHYISLISGPSSFYNKILYVLKKIDLVSAVNRRI